MKDTIISYGWKLGLINGALAIIIIYGSWAAGIQVFSTVQLWVTFIPYMIVILLLAGLKLKKENDGYLSFKDALKFSFFSYVICGIIIGIGTYFLYNFIDKTLSDKSFEIGLEKVRQVMEKSKATETQIDTAISNARKSKTDTGFKTIFLGYGFGLILDFVKCLVLSIAIKKERPVLNEL